MPASVNIEAARAALGSVEHQTRICEPAWRLGVGMSGPRLGGRGAGLGLAAGLKSASRPTDLRRHRASFGITVKSAVLRPSAGHGRAV